MKTINVKTSARIEMKDVTSEVSKAVKESGVKSGICVVYVPHTTAAVTINESADPDVARDIIDALKEQYPQSKRWRHAEGNADSHVKCTLVSPSISIPIDEGRLSLGTWQGIFFCEFDGPRSRELFVQVVKSSGS